MSNPINFQTLITQRNNANISIRDLAGPIIDPDAEEPGEGKIYDAWLHENKFVEYTHLTKTRTYQFPFLSFET